MKVKWNIDTGYVSRIPDFEYEVDEYDLNDWAFDLTSGATEEDIAEEISGVIKEEFEQRIACFATNEEDVLAEVRRRAEKIFKVVEKFLWLPKTIWYECPDTGRPYKETRWLVRAKILCQYRWLGSYGWWSKERFID